MTNLNAFLSGCLLVALTVLLYVLKNVQPVINTDNYIESVEQSIRKIKQTGNNNDATVIPTIEIKEKPKPPESLVEWFKNRKLKKSKL